MNNTINRLPDPLIENILSYVPGNCSAVCKRFQKIIEEPAKRVGRYIFREHGRDDFLEKLNSRHVTRFDVQFAKEDEANTLNEETWTQLKKALPYIREVRFSGFAMNNQFIGDTFVYFPNIEKLALAIQQKVDLERACNLERAVLTKVSTLGQLHSLQLHHFTIHIQAQRELPFRWQLVRLDTGKSSADFGVDPESTETPQLNLPVGLQYLKVAEGWDTSYLVNGINQLSQGNCQVDVTEANLFIRTSLKTASIAEKCCCRKFSPFCKGLTFAGPPLTIGFVTILFPIAFALSVAAMTPIAAPFFLIPTYSRVYQTALVTLGQGPVNALYTDIAASLSSHVATYSLAYGAYKVIKGTISITQKIWNITSRLFSSPRRIIPR